MQEVSFKKMSVHLWSKPPQLSRTTAWPLSLCIWVGLEAKAYFWSVFLQIHGFTLLELKSDVCPRLM